MSRQIQEVIIDTTYIKLPLRASDLSQNHTITKLLSEYGFHSLYQCLHLIVENRLDYLIAGLEHKKAVISGKEKIDWYFYKAKSLKKKKVLTASRLEIDLLIKPKMLYFSEREMTILEKYKRQFEDLINGEVNPKTELQERFKQVALSLLERRKEKTAPKYYYEKIIAKYLLFKYYLKIKSAVKEPE